MARCDGCMKNPVHPDKKCCFNCARSYTDCEVWHTCGEDCPGWKSKIKTIGDKIRAMSDQELARRICGGAKYSDCACSFCGKNNGEFCNGEWCRDKTDEEIIMEWLQKPVEEA